MRRLTFFFLSVIIITGSVFGQNLHRVVFDNHIVRAKAITDTVYRIETNYPTTGIVVCIDSTDDFGGAYLAVKSDTLYLIKDDERGAVDGKIYSNLFTFGGYTSEFDFFPGTLSKEVKFIFIDAELDKVSMIPKKKAKKSAGCTEPEMIDQSVWREGLTPPDYTRTVHDVHNVIIHHSAGSNTDTNYINVVRNIYLFHTQEPDLGRGWSDIGYNYLIAQDGTIFKGRDPGTYEQDNVKGAHFCGVNTGTMGICVLGNYVEVTPPEEALTSLVELLNWKLGKDSLDPQGVYPHSLNSGLHVIAGHRDGCATLCPGDSLYIKLDDIRQETMDAFTACGFVANEVVNILDHGIEGLNIYQDKNHLLISYDKNEPIEIRIIDKMGRRISVDYELVETGEIEIQTNSVLPGIYFLIVNIGDKTAIKKLFLH